MHYRNANGCKGTAMNKYESSGLEAKYQLTHASNAMKHQRAMQARKAYNPLYPKEAEDSVTLGESRRDEQRLQEDQGLAEGQRLEENPGPQGEQSGVEQEEPGSGDKNP